MIGNTVSVDRRMTGEVYELIDLFPYFQSAHLLLLKGLHNSADIKFENQLRQSALHAGDRGVLYWLLQSSGEPELKAGEPLPMADVKHEVDSDTQQTVIESARNSDLLIDEIEKDSVGNLNELTDTHDHSVMVASEPDSSEPDGVIFLNEEAGTEPVDTVFFMDPGFAVPDHSELLELDLEEDDSFILDESEPIVEQDKTSRKQFQSDLIDRFIIANPRIEPQKDKSFVANEDISKPFVEESDGLVTETLAKIYVGQGYYSKAIDIYEKLSLKFPEKSSYFATQIEKVKEHIKK
jgi:hypothetical protein